MNNPQRHNAPFFGITQSTPPPIYQHRKCQSSDHEVESQVTFVRNSDMQEMLPTWSNAGMRGLNGQMGLMSSWTTEFSNMCASPSPSPIRAALPSYDAAGLPQTPKSANGCPQEALHDPAAIAIKKQ